MISSIFILMVSIFYLGILGILINRLHFLSILLCLELLLMSLFLTMTILAINLHKTMLFSKNLMLLTLSACEASAGLSLLVALSRTHKSDLVSNMKILQQ